MNKEEFLEYEDRLAKLFVNSTNSNRLANAYLLYGERNTPLKDTALFIAHSLNCENGPLVCGECPSCRRFLSGVRPDFVLIDGEKETIKKEMILSLEKKFSMSALEKGHRLCYVINRVDNITDEACNSLLKFLEEPKEGQVAILTTNNIEKVLPTIRSRAILFRVFPVDREGFRNRLMNTEFKNEKNKKITLSEGEAYMLSKLYADVSDVEELLSEDSSFLDGYHAAETFLQDYTVSSKTGAFSLLRETSFIKDNKCYNFLYLTLDTVFTQALTGDIEPDNPFKESIDKLSLNRTGLSKAKEIVSLAISAKQVNLNPALISARIGEALSEGQQ